MTLAPTLSPPLRSAVHVGVGAVPSSVLTELRRTRGLTAARMFVAVTAVLIGGTTVAILTTPDPLWWHLHFSRLGTFPVFSGEMFNGTLVTVGLLMVIVAFRLHHELSEHAERSLSHERSPRILSILVALFGADLAVVGLVPINTFRWVHEVAASGTTLSFVGLLVATPWLVRGLRRSHVTMTLPAGAILVVGYAAMTTSAINLAAFELIGFTTMFVWLVLFLGCLAPGVASSSRLQPRVPTATD